MKLTATVAWPEHAPTIPDCNPNPGFLSRGFLSSVARPTNGEHENIVFRRLCAG